MFIKAINVKFLDGVNVELTYIDGSVIRYDMSSMYEKYPQLKQLENRKLFESGHLDSGGYGIIWNDDLDFDAMSIYEDGEKVGRIETTLNQQLGYEITKAREKAGLTQVELAKLSGIDQGDISKLERGQGNPSINKINKLLNSLNVFMEIKVVNNNSIEDNTIYNKYSNL